MKKKVIARVFGGLGNQLFCYAAARRLAIKNDAELVIDHISGFKYDYKYRRSYQLHKFDIPCRLADPSERFEPFPRIRRAIRKRVEKLRPFHRRGYISQEGMEFDERLLDLKFQKKLYIEGYWQSEKYFKDIEHVIRKEFTLKNIKSDKNLKLSDLILQKNSVAVHFRLFGETDEHYSVNSSLKYYRKSIEKITQDIENPHYFVFSDNPQKAGHMFGKFGLPFTLISHNNSDQDAHLDLWLMSQCNHFIIANSTFSWWGAWLSKNSNKMVIAPGSVKKAGTGAWGFEGMLPKRWIKCFY